MPGTHWGSADPVSGSQTGAECQQGTASGGLAKTQTSGLNKPVWKRLIDRRGRARGEVWAAAQAAQEPPPDMLSLGSPWRCQCRNPQPQRVPSKLRPLWASPGGSDSPGRLTLEESVLSLTPSGAEGHQTHPHSPPCAGAKHNRGQCLVTAQAQSFSSSSYSSSHRHKRRFLSKNYARHCKNPKACKIM